MSRIAHTAFVAFVSAIVMLWVVARVQEPTGEAPADGAERVFSMETVAEHDSRESCWKVIDGVVYDFTDYHPDHPTADGVFLRWCGREASKAWHGKGEGRGHSPRAEGMLEDYRIGVLRDGDS